MRTSTLHEKVESIRGHKFIRLKSGRKITFWDAIREVESGHSVLNRGFSRAFKLADPRWDYETIEWRLDHLQEHINALRHYLTKLRGHETKKDRIARLRNTAGRTPEEAEMYLMKADQLEREMEGEK